ncbi:MAG: PorP/SprF family type IX secretion system membrane protein [Bacteroidaceae bacterium]|nr:PorP/SprF family type IX secretion system membrane protein [Bacteroidaceae bacterium]
MKRLLWIGMLIVSLTVRAQFDAAFTNTWALQSYYNPAAAGLDSKLNVVGMYSLQMVGYQGAPKTMVINADMPLFFVGPKHGVGAAFLNDDIGAFSNKKIQLQYAFHQKFLGGRASIGIRPALLMVGFDGSDLDLIDSGDPAFAQNDIKGNAFDLDIGLRYTYKKLWYAGVSAVHLLGPTIKMGDDKTHEVSIDPMFMVQGGYNLAFRQPQYKLAMDAMVRSDLTFWRGDINARLMYEGNKHKLYGGLMYSPTISVGLLLGFDFHGINIGYSYEVYTGGVGVLNGTHEILIGYQHDLDVFKKGKNLHKSVRLL